MWHTMYPKYLIVLAVSTKEKSPLPTYVLLSRQIMQSKKTHLEPRKPTGLLFGTSNISWIRPEKRSQYVDVTKVTAYTLDETRSKIETTETRADVVLLHVFTNDIKTNTPEEKHEVNTYVISSKWSNTKTIVSLTTQRMNHIRLIILPEEDVVMG